MDLVEHWGLQEWLIWHDWKSCGGVIPRPRVRIPQPQPEWRGDRAVDGDCLLNRCGVTATVGSNPTLSAGSKNNKSG